MVFACGAVGLGASRSPAAVGVTISSAPGANTAFEPARASVTAEAPVTVTFRNVSRVPHNLTFTGALTAATRTIVEPGAWDEVVLPPLPAGTYPFVCTIHDGMSGTLTVVTV